MEHQDYFTKERIGVFVFIVSMLGAKEIYSVQSGLVQSYDDEWYMFLGSVAIVFIGCFRPKLFDRAFDLVFDFVGRFFGK